MVLGFPNGDFILNTSEQTEPGLYELWVVRVDDAGEYVFSNDEIGLQPDETMYVNFFEREGDGSPMYLDVDGGGDGTIDDASSSTSSESAMCNAGANGADDMTTSESSAIDQNGSDDKPSHDVLEVIATVVLGVAITLIAWNALQSSLWSGEQAKATTDAVLTSNASNDSYQLADGTKTLDQLLFVEIFTSGVCDDGENADDVACEQIINNMSDPGQDALFAWFDNDELLPFDSDAYGEEIYSEADALDVESNEFVVAADQANTNADRYDTASTTLATVLFFAGISLVIAWRRLRVVLLAIASVILIGSGIYVATLPMV